MKRKTPYRIETISFAKSKCPHFVFYNSDESTTSKTITTLRKPNLENKYNLAFSPAIKPILRQIIVDVISKSFPVAIDYGQVIEPRNIKYLRKRHIKIKTTDEDAHKHYVLEKTLIIDGEDINSVLLKMAMGKEQDEQSVLVFNKSIYIIGHNQEEDEWCGILPAYESVNMIKNCNTDFNDINGMTNDLKPICERILKEFGCTVIGRC